MMYNKDNKGTQRSIEPIKDKNPLSRYVREYLGKTPANVNGYVMKTTGDIKQFGKEDVTYEMMREAVGGLIEIVYYIEDDVYEVIVDEEGLCKNKELNVFFFLLTGFWLAGDVLVVKKGMLK